MKNRIVKISLIVALCVPMMLSAQTTIDKLYARYAGQEGFTSINISPDMFKMLSGMDMGDSSKEAKGAQDAMQQLSGLKMLVFEPKDGKTSDFVKELRALTPSSDYAELMSVDDEDSKIRFLVKKKNNGNVSELLMIVLEANESMIMSMTGDIDMKTISGISKSLNMQGLDKLEKLDEK